MNFMINTPSNFAPVESFSVIEDTYTGSGIGNPVDTGSWVCDSFQVDVASYPEGSIDWEETPVSDFFSMIDGDQ